MKVNIKRNITLAISGVVTLLLITIGLSFAYFTANITGQETGTTITVGAGTMNITYTNNSSIITASDIYPRSEAWVTKTFTVAGNNTTNLDMAYSAAFIMEENTFSNNALSYTLDSTNTDSNGEVITPTTENMTLSTGYSINHLGNGYFIKTNGSKTHTYTLKVYFLDTDENQNEDQGKTFNGYVSMAGIECADCLTDNVVASAGGKELINTSDTPEFNKISPTAIYKDIKTEHAVVLTSNNNKTVGTSYTYNSRSDEYTLKGIITQTSYSTEYIGYYTCNSNGASCNTLYQINEVSGTSVINSTKIESGIETFISGDSGIYATEDDYGTSYYYRGIAKSNYVLFANMCWRIVRIIGDGSIKLVLSNYNPNFVENPCDESQNGDTNAFPRFMRKNYGDDYEETYVLPFNYSSYDAKYVGYMYGGLDGGPSTTREEAVANEVESEVKIQLEKWYEENLIDYTNYLTDTLWCNDREIHNGTGFGKTTTEYSASRRFHDYKHTLLCNNKNDRFTVSDTKIGNGKSKFPVGLLTSDEVGLAGGIWVHPNKGFYLYENANENWWLMSPYMGTGVMSSHGFSVKANGSYGEASIPSDRALRPSIALKSNTKIIGSGTSSNPYKVIS